MNNIKVALVHDWLTGMRGGEKCLEVFCELFPEATVFTLIHKKGSVSPTIEKMKIQTSFLQNIPGIFKNYRNFLPFYPAAIENFNLGGYDLVLSSSHCVAKGVNAPSNALHICYCYTPMRYAWKFFDEYFAGENKLKRWAISAAVKYLKRWDLRSNKKVDYFIAISDNVKNRIGEFYKREADVIYPPADIDAHAKLGKDEGFYLIVSALVPYKKVDLAVKVFNENGKPLIVIGSGPEFSRLQKESKSNISFRGWASDSELNDYYADCSALIFPGEEDFGIVPVEAQSHGKPVIAYAKGGALETIIPFSEELGMASGASATGVFFKEQTAASLKEAIETFEKNRSVFDPDIIRDNALKFNRGRFKREIREYIDSKWEFHVKKQLGKV